MDKTIQLDQKELQTAQAIDQQLMQAWARIGVLSEQNEQARKARDQAIEQQRGFIAQTVAARGIDRFNQAVPGPNGTIVVTMPDDLQMAVAMEAPAKPNGVAALEQ